MIMKTQSVSMPFEDKEGHETRRSNAFERCKSIIKSPEDQGEEAHKGTWFNSSDIGCSYERRCFDLKFGANSLYRL